MSRKVVQERSDEAPLSAGWQAPEETAPSIVRVEGPLLTRVIGFVGLLLVIMAAMAFLVNSMTLPINIRSRISNGLAVVFFLTGIGGMLFHAAGDQDVQFRRTYGVFGFVWLLAGAILSFWPYEGQTGTLFLPYGCTCLGLGLLFLLPFERNETDLIWREVALRALGLAGLVCVLFAFIGGNLYGDFLTTRGLALALLGLCFVWAFIGLEGTETRRGYRTALGLGVVGGLFFLVALARSVLPPLFFTWGWLGSKPSFYLVPYGLLLMTLGLLYVGVSLGIWSDNQLVVETRRELASYFFSPIAYIVIFVLVVIDWFKFLWFVGDIVEFSQGLRGLPDASNDPLIEPIVRLYVFDFFTIIALVFIIPALTMRLLSEERRTGTLEMLFTAPVQEWTVVAGKFLAAFIVFLLAWLPSALFLLALRVEGGREFDFRPLLTYYLAVAVSGAGFISMGLFFSSFTRNQIAAAILTFLGMMVLTGFYIIKQFLIQNPDNTWYIILSSISYVDLWLQARNGVIVPQYLVFHLSATVFWLFLTTKVLEARKWT
jgi:ABC-type transport system involved in multi-copper enzyme maturation permease subunit